MLHYNRHNSCGSHPGTDDAEQKKTVSYRLNKFIVTAKCDAGRIGGQFILQMAIIDTSSTVSTVHNGKSFTNGLSTNSRTDNIIGLLSISWG